MKIPKLPFSKTIIDVQWAFISIVTASLAHFILRIVLGRELGPDGLGVYTLAFTIYLFGMQFAAFGIGAALTKFVAQFIDDPITIRNYVSSGMTSSIITGTIMGVVLFLLAPVISISFFDVPELEPLLKLTAICYPFIAIQKAVLGTLNGFRRMHLFALLEITQNVAVVCISIILVLLYGMGVMGAVVGFVIPTVVISFLSIVLIRDSFVIDLSQLFDKSCLRATTIFGLYVVLGNSFSFLNGQIDSIMIGYYLTTNEVGIYAVAILLAQTLYLIPSAIQRVTTPLVATLYEKGEYRSIRRLLISTMIKTMTIILLMSLILLLFGKNIIHILFGIDYIIAYIPLMILLLGHIVHATYTSIGSTLASIGKVNMLFRLTVISTIINLVFNILLIPIFGILGAAIATTVSNIINTTIKLTYLKKYTIIFK